MTAPEQDDNKKKSEELEKELQQIYADPDGKLPNFTRLDGRPRHRFLALAGWLFFFLAALSGVSWTGFFFFLKPSAFTGDKVVLSIDAPESLTAGGAAELAIVYRNDERVPVASAVVSAELPKEEFILESSDPAADQSGQWPLGSLAPGREGRITLKGWVRKEPGATLTARATLTYKPADFNSSFQKVSSRTMPVVASAIKVTGQGPEDLTPGDQEEFAYEIENVSDRPLEGLEFRLDPLEGFVFASAEPVPEAERTDRWPLPTLEPGGKATISVRGTFSSAARGPQSLHGRVGFAVEDAFVSIAEGDAKTSVQKSDLALNLVVNGSAQAPAAALGDTLHFSLNWKNAGDVHLKDVTLSAELPSQPAGTDLIDWPSLKDDLGGKRQGTAIAWDKKQVPGLEDLAPGDEGTVNFSVQLVKKVPESAKTGRLEVDAQSRAAIAKVGKGASREIVGTPLVIRLNSDTVFKATARYFDESGVPLGSGPLPPKQGEKTTYRVFWTVTNSLHELSNLTATTLLPQGVKWTGVPRQVDAGDLSFDESGRQATWRLNRLPTSVSQVVVSFDVEVTPDPADVGNIIDLAGESKLEALDQETESVILKTERPLGTDLIGDESAAGKGVVRE